MKPRSFAAAAVTATLTLVLVACGGNSANTPTSSGAAASAAPVTSSAASSAVAGTSAAGSDTGAAGSASSGSSVATSAGTAATSAVGSSSGADTASAGGGAGTTITVWADETRAKPLGDIAKKFETDTGATVKIVQKDFGKIQGDFISQAPTGKGPDIIVGAHDWLGKLVQNGVVAPLELGDKAAQFQQVAIDAMTFNGQVYGLPYAVENVALIRNTTLAPNAPKDYDDAIATGNALVKAGKAKFPFLLQQDPSSGDPYHMYPFQTSFGAPVFGLNSKGGFDSKNLQMKGAAGEKFAAWLAQQGKAGIVRGTITADVAKNAFLKGQAPYIVTGPWNTGDFTKAGLKFSVEAIPSAGGQPAKPFVGVQGFFVSSKSKSQLLADNFVLNYLSTEEVQMALYSAGGRPPALTVAFDKVKSDPIMAGFGKVGAAGTPQPNIPAMDAVWSDWGTTELAIINGKGDPKTLWDKMSSSIESKIAGG